MVKLNEEKKNIINQNGNILVTANPGTGKTLLLAHKYVKLIEDGINPSEILCLTFTKKATKEMKERIWKLIQEKDIDIDFSELNIYTFHSYAKDNILEEDMISSNMLRYVIYDYLRKNDVLSYGDNYIVETIVPKLENLLRYIKSYGVLPKDIDIEKTKENLKRTNTLSKEEMEAFAEIILNIYEEYENIKEGVGLDYSDLLIKYLKLNNKEKYEYVLVDELQDVNELEGEIAIASAQNFIAVGDKKQAIFGFQGGSIENFKLFKDSKKFILSDNFRSTNQILNYAKSHFEKKTKNDEYVEDLKNLKSAKDKNGSKPIVYEYDDDKKYWDAVSTLVENIIEEKKGEEIAIITRTNYQITEIARELKNRGVDFEITLNSASNKAKENIIKYIKGILSNKVEDVKQSLFTPFSPIELRKAFEISDEKKLSIELIEEKSPEIKRIRNKIKSVNDLEELFINKIIPISVSCGQGYLLAATTLQKSYQEFMNTIKDKTLHNLVVYLNSTDLLVEEFNSEGDIVLSTVHKAKGRQFDTVIYVPSENKKRTFFWDKIGEAMLKTKNIDAREELEEESLRIDFVGMTRAKKELHVLPDNHSEYINNFCTSNFLDVSKSLFKNKEENLKEAFKLFVNKEYERAKELLENKGEKWIQNRIKNHFKNLEHLSFSSAEDNPVLYLKNKILNIQRKSKAMDLGSMVHKLAEKIINKSDDILDFEIEDLKEYRDRIVELIEEIKKEYPEVLSTEERIDTKMNKIIDGVDTDILFIGYIDAIFKNDDGEYLIVDWKTSKRKDYSADHRRQLGMYKKAYAKKHNIPIKKIKTAIGYLGLQKRVKIDKPWAELCVKQPTNQLINTFEKRIKVVLKWKENPIIFFEELKEKMRSDKNLKSDPLMKAIIEQYECESK